MFFLPQLVLSAGYIDVIDLSGFTLGRNLLMAIPDVSYTYIAWLVVWNMIFVYLYWEESSQLTNSYF